MLFNSYEFIFAFLPVVVAVFFVLGRVSRVWALRWVIAASLFFYGWWRPLNVLIIAPSVLINFALARVLQRLGNSPVWHCVQCGISRLLQVLEFSSGRNQRCARYADGSSAHHLAAWNIVYHISKDRLLN
jgi:D-alanyl-lipoteichoic acid acyltransferase DltB (MBOAT superfamily)